jgi:signal transduction histidine kinase
MVGAMVLDAAPTTGDPLLLERMVLNLVPNAVRHNVPGGRLDVRTGREPSGAVLEVSNTGPEIRPYEVDTLFEPFRRLHNERIQTDRGVGLGLSIVRSVTRAHGGAVTAAPRQGGGLVVRVILPAPS